MISGKNDMPLGPIPEDPSRASDSIDDRSHSSSTPIGAVPPRPLPAVPVSVKKTKSKKSTTKLSMKYDQSGSPIVEKKKIKIDEFGKPIKKKKIKSGRGTTEPTSLTTKSSQPPGPELPPKQSAPPAPLLPHRPSVASSSGPGLDSEIQSFSDSISTIGQMSAAEIVRQSRLQQVIRQTTFQQRQQQQHHHQQQQQHHQHPHAGDGIDFNASFTDSKRSTSTGRSPIPSLGPLSITSRLTGSVSQQSSAGKSNAGPPEAGREDDDGFGPVFPNPGHGHGNNIARRAAAATMVTNASSAVVNQSRSDTHALVVQYMISTGADPAVAEQLACEFEEAQQRGMDNYATAAKSSNNPVERKQHDVDKFAMFAEGDDEGPVEKGIVRALAQGVGPELHPTRPGPPVPVAPNGFAATSASGPTPHWEMPSSADSVSTMGQMSAAELARQSHYRQARLRAQQQARQNQMQQKQQQQKQQQQQQPHAGDGAEYNASNVGPPEAGREDDDGFGPVFPNPGHGHGNNIARRAAAATMVTNASSAVVNQSRSDTHALVVQYMISTGADPAVAEQLACEFEEAQQRGMDNYATAAKSSNNPVERKQHDVDKFAMFAEGDDDGSVESVIIRALAQGVARAEREQEDYSQSASRTHVAAGQHAGAKSYHPAVAAAPATLGFPAVAAPPPPAWGYPPVAAAPPAWGSPHAAPVPAWGPPPSHAARAWGPPPGAPRRPDPTIPLTHSVSPMAPDTREENPDAVRALLIQYLISVGTDPRVAEQMADQFNQQHSAPPAAARHQQQQEELQAFQNKQLDAMNGHRQGVPGFNANITVPGRGPMSQSTPVMNPMWPRAERPGAVEMEGRAFGAPRRPQGTIRGPAIEELELEREIAQNPFIIEATPVKENDYNGEVVYAESASTYGMKHILQERSIRRTVCLVCLLFVGIVAVATYVAVKALTKSSSPFNAQTSSPTGTPTSAPSFIGDDIEQAAGTISGFGSVLTIESSQRRAVGWLSSIDRFDTQGFGYLFSQRYIFIVLYYATNGDQWLEQDNWLSPNLHICDWSVSIICGADINQRRVVTGIDLTRNGLSGSIPDEIGLFNGLTMLRLARNSIKGTIPESITKLSGLLVLDLSMNQLSGTMAAEFGNLQSLVSLELQHNALTGPIPSSTYELGLLEKLDLSDNKLTGPLSQDLRKLQSLATLNIRNNELNGQLPLFTDLDNLDFIILDSNQFSGTLPNLALDILGRLEFSIANNRITGRVPGLKDVNVSEYVNLVMRIQRVDISYNQLTGTIDPEIALVPSFRYIDLSWNSFTGLVPAQASTPGGWGSLEHFAVAGNQFSGTFPLGLHSTLTFLDLSDNRFTGGIPLEMYSIYPNLEYLVLANNPFGGRISGLLGKLVALRTLKINNCTLTGLLPENIWDLQDLEIFDFQDNAIGGTIPQSFGTLGVLRELKFKNNNLTGTLPIQLGSLDQLNILNLANNKLTGEVPTVIGFLSKLVEFDVSGNLFVGTVPEGVCVNVNMTRAMVGCSLECSCCSDDGTNICAGNNQGGLRRNRH